MALLTRPLLVVCPEGTALRAFACAASIAGWRVMREELLELPAADLNPEAWAATVRPLALRWSLPPGTEVALVLPVLSGGILALRNQDQRKTAQAIDLSGNIPFPQSDILTETRQGDPRRGAPDQIAWIPRSTALELRNAFARSGLTLGEIVFRAQVYAAAAEVTGSVRLLAEKWGDLCALHALKGDRVLGSSLANTATAREFVDRLNLELLTLGAAGNAATRVDLAAHKGEFDGECVTACKDGLPGTAVERYPVDFSRLFLRFWQRGDSGIWLVPDTPAALGTLRRIAFFATGLGVLLAGTLAWHASAVRDEIGSLQAREGRMRPQYQALLAKERQAATLAEVANAADRLMTPAGDVQDALLATFNALPRNAWVTRLTVGTGTGTGKVTVTGRGQDSSVIVSSLNKQPGVSQVEDASKEPADSGSTGSTPRFRVRFQVGKETAVPGPQTTSAKAPQ